MGSKKQRTLISLILTVAVITLLLLSGPASAITVGVTDVDDTTPNESGSMNFLFVADIHTNDVIDLSYASVNISAAGDVDTCDFYIGNASNKSSCSDFTINSCWNNATYGASAGYGYGYGYNTTGFGWLNFSATSGYGYTTGYGSDAFNATLTTVGDAEIVCNITWTTPSVTSSTAYTIDAMLWLSDGSTKFTSETDTTVTVQNVEASTGGTGSGSNAGVTVTVDETEAVTDTTGEVITDTTAIATYLNDLGLDWDPTTTALTLQSATSTKSGLGVSGLQEMIALATDASAKTLLTELLGKLNSGENLELQVTQILNVYKVVNEETGEVAYRTMVVLEAVAPQDLQYITVVTVIPKSVVKDASELVAGDYTTLQADPILQWTFNTASTNGKLSGNYVVVGEVKSLESQNLATGKAVISEEEGTSLWWLWLLIIIVIIIVVYFSLRKK